MPKIVERMLRAGEGRIIKKLSGLTDQVNALWMTSNGYLTPSCARRPIGSRSDWPTARSSTTCCRRPSRPVGRRRLAPRPAPLRRTDHGWRCAASRQHRRDEDRRGQDPGRDRAELPQRARRQGCPRRHRQRLPRGVPVRADGPRAPLPRPDHGRDPRPRWTRRCGASSTPWTSPTAQTTSSASTTCATTWPGRPRTSCSAATTSRSLTRSTRSWSTRTTPR